MGQALINCAEADPELAVSAALDHEDDFASALAGCDAVIDFTHADVTLGVAEACAKAGKVLVIGTTVTRMRFVLVSRSSPKSSRSFLPQISAWV